MAKDAQITIRLTSDELDRFQVLADKYGTTRHKLIHGVLSTGLDTIEELDSVGILKASLYAHNATNFIKEFVSPSRSKSKLQSS